MIELLKKTSIRCFFVSLFFTSCFAQLTAQENSLTYDLRSCDDGFATIWDYYSNLTDKLFADRMQLRENQGAGRFSDRFAIPNLSAIAEKLGADGQISANILWRDMGRDRAFRFVVQRSQDVHSKIYYPFYVHEEYQWQNFPPTPQCQKQALRESIPKASKTQLSVAPQPQTRRPKAKAIQPTAGRQPTSGQTLSAANFQSRHTHRVTAPLFLQNLPVRMKHQKVNTHKLPLRQFKGKVELRLIAQNQTENQAENQAQTSVRLEVANAQELCTWQQRYGEAVIIPAQQLPGSSGWRFRDQKNLPYGLTRLQLYLRGTPYPLAYTSYDGRNYAIMADFENGYRVHYLPRIPSRIQISENSKLQNIQISGTVMFWLAPVIEIPAGLPLVSLTPSPEDLASSDCSTYIK